VPAPHDPPGGDARSPFEYAIVRVLPRVERGESFNAGIVLMSRPRRYLGARTELDDRTFGIGIDIARHGARKNFAGRRYRADLQRIFEPGANEAQFVIDADAALLLECAQLMAELLLDCFFLGVELRFKQAELALKPLFERPPLFLEETDLLSDLFFELLKRRQGHCR